MLDGNAVVEYQLEVPWGSFLVVVEQRNFDTPWLVAVRWFVAYSWGAFAYFEVASRRELAGVEGVGG
jgi:hypothetical protein